MKKVILPIFLLVFLLILAGCNVPQQETKPIQSVQSQDQTMNTAPVNKQSATIEQPATQEENDINLDQEINNLDQSLQQISDTDFSENELSDSNLGI